MPYFSPAAIYEVVTSLLFTENPANLSLQREIRGFSENGIWQGSAKGISNMH
jgi:hypothetical protein